MAVPSSPSDSRASRFSGSAFQLAFEPGKGALKRLARLRVCPLERSRAFGGNQALIGLGELAHGVVDGDRLDRVGLAGDLFDIDFRGRACGAQRWIEEALDVALYPQADKLPRWVDRALGRDDLQRASFRAGFRACPPSAPMELFSLIA